MKTPTLDALRTELRKPNLSTAALATIVDQASGLAEIAREQMRHTAFAFAQSALASSAERKKLSDASAAARDAAGDVNAVLREAERLRDEAHAADEQERCASLYEAGRRASETAAAMLAKEYPRAARTLLGILRQLAEAQQVVATANGSLPKDAEPLPDPEHAARGTPGRSREIVSDEQIELWGRVDQSIPVEQASQASIYDLGGGWGRRRGYDAGTLSMGEPQANYRRRVFRKITYREAEPGSWPVPLAAALQLPALRGDQMLWGESYSIGYSPTLARVAMGAAEPGAVLASLEQIEIHAAAKSPKFDRPLKVEWASYRDVVPLPLETPSERASTPLGRGTGKFGASPFAPGRAAGGRR